jgi:carbon-monoxide dehydrogenase small subunit
MAGPVKFKVNGTPVELDVDRDRKLLWVLRTELGLTGTKYGCGRMICGACTVLMDGEPTRSCLTPVGRAEGKQIVTIEGLAEGDTLHPVQQAFADHGALQCGFCTPGMILTSVALLERNPRPSREQIIEALDRNLCRCGAHTRILDAVEAASLAMEGAPR